MSSFSNGFEPAPPKVWVLTCQSFDDRPYPPVCVSEEWVLSHELPVSVSNSFVPELSTADASQIGMAIAMVWIIGWAWREIRRSLFAGESRE